MRGRSRRHAVPAICRALEQAARCCRFPTVGPRTIASTRAKGSAVTALGFLTPACVKESLMVQSRIKRARRSSRSARCASVFCASILSMAGAASAQQPAADTRAARVAAEQQEKATRLKPYEPNKAEVWVAKLEEQFITGSLNWHPFFAERVRGWWVHARRRVPDPRQQLQHDQRSRQLHVHRIQTD